MTTLLTTLAMVIAMGFAIESSTLSTDTGGSVANCSEPIGELPPPPVD